MICAECGKEFSDHASLRGHLMTEQCEGKKMRAVRKVNDKPVLWTDKKGVTHSAEGDWLTPQDFCLWTVCGSADVPANKGYHPGSDDRVTCPNCISKL